MWQQAPRRVPPLAQAFAELDTRNSEGKPHKLRRGVETWFGLLYGNFQSGPLSMRHSITIMLSPGAFVLAVPLLAPRLPVPALPHGAVCIASIHQFRSRNIAWLIEQCIDSFEESRRVRQFGVLLECRFVRPLRMDVKEPSVSHRTEQVKAPASWFLARRTEHVAQRVLNGTLLSLTRVQPHKHVLLHDLLLPPTAIL